MFDAEASNRDNDAVLDAQERPTARQEYDWAVDYMVEADWYDLEDGETYDGCVVEPDGQCPHGYRSWQLVAGII